MEDQAKKSISHENKERLILETSKSMKEVAKLVDQARKSIRIIDEAETQLSSKVKNMGDELPDQQHHLRRLAEYTLVVALIHLDMTSAVRIYLKGTEPYDTTYATKQLLVTINEGYKQIYQYVTSIDGKLDEDKRKKSYWVKDMGRLINSELPELLPTYNTITAALNLYDDKELKEMTKPRNLAVHYDKNASKVYDMLIALDIETMSKKAIPFISILNDMVHFSLETLVKYEKLIQVRTNELESFHINKLEDLKSKHPEATDLLTMIQQDVKNFLKL
jgi:hypothetical protein